MDFFPNTHLKPHTYQPYNSKLNKWISLFSKSQATLLFIYSHPNYCLTILRNYLTEHNIDTAATINSYIKAILAAADNAKIHTDTHKDRWIFLRNHFYQLSVQYRLDAEPAPTQANKAGAQLSFEQLCEIRDKLPQYSIEKLLIAFYTYIPPVRADYFSTQILPFGEIPTHPNYIYFSPERSSMTLTDFKTSAIYKSIHQDLPPTLHSLLAHSLSIQPRKFLFINRLGQPFERNNFSTWASELLQKTLQKSFTLTLFRHIYISHLDPSLTPGELQNISQQMGHSLTQQILYRWKSKLNTLDE
jgi:integrase